MDEPTRLLVIFTSSSETWGELPLAEALVKKLCSLGIEGGTAHNASIGFGSKRKVRTHSLVGVDEHRPVMITAADSERRLRDAIPHLRALAPHNTMLLVEAELIPRRSRRLVDTVAGTTSAEQRPQSRIPVEVLR